MESLIGFLIAVAVGMTGMGGGVLAAPVLILFLNMPAAEAVGSSLIFVTVTKLVAAPMYIFRKQVSWSTLVVLLMGGIPGVVLGSLLIGKMAKKNLEPVVLTLVGGTILIIAVATLIKMLRTNSTAPGKDRPRWILPLLTFPIGLEVGFSSAGAGALGSLVLMNTTSLAAATIVGTDLMFGWSVAMVGGGIHLALGEVNMAVVWKLLAGGIAGAIAGSWVATWMPSRALRYALAGFLIFLGSQLLMKGLGSL